MPRVANTVRDCLMFIHRWMGTAFCVLFLAWFCSGIVMMYCRFPQVGAEDRLSRSQPLDPSRIRVTPERAFAEFHGSGAPSQIRVNLMDGRPVYRFAFGRRCQLVFADDGRRLDAIPQEMARRIASVWTALPANTSAFQGLVTEDDQWTVYSPVQPYGPFWKYSWPNGEEVYVSRTSGEVMQDTTRRSRLGAYFGAIPHWLYFTPLRRNGAFWSQLVAWLSGAGTVTSIVGLAVGIWLYSPSKRYRFPQGASSIPYRGPKRWHMILGLIFGVVTCTWVFSGLLSMEPFAWLTDRDRSNLDRALRGTRLDVAKYAGKDPRQAIADAGMGLRVKELEFASFDGAAVYLALETPRSLRIVPVNGVPQEMFDPRNILDAVTRAVSPLAIVETRLVKHYEPYYVDRQKQKPLPVLYLQLNDSSQSAYYIDPRTGRVVQSYSAHSRWNRWLYHGLHSLDIPLLYAWRPAWDIIVIVLLVGGSALSITALLIAGRLVRRKLSGRRVRSAI